MNKIIMLVGFVFMSLQLWCQDISLNIGLQIEKVYYDFQSDLYMTGVFTFENELDKKITLPRTFDLSLQIFDNTNKLILINSDIAYEYVNLITSRKRIRIKPNCSISINFFEWRLFAHPLKIGDEYKIQYLLNPDLYPKLRKYLDQRTIVTNKVMIRIPDKKITTKT